MVQGGRPPSWRPKPPRLGENKAEQPGLHGSAGSEGDPGGSPKAATAIRDRFLHLASVITLTGKRYRLRNQGHQAATGNGNKGKASQRDEPPA